MVPLPVALVGEVGWVSVKKADLQLVMTGGYVNRFPEPGKRAFLETSALSRRDGKEGPVRAHVCTCHWAVHPGSAQDATFEPVIIEYIDWGLGHSCVSGSFPARPWS